MILFNWHVYVYKHVKGCVERCSIVELFTVANCHVQYSRVLDSFTLILVTVGRYFSMIFTVFNIIMKSRLSSTPGAMWTY